MKTVIACVVFVVLSSFSWVLAIAQEPPDWATRLPNIPELDDHYQGLGITTGSGDINKDWEAAINRARANLINQITVHIVSEMTSRIIETEESGNYKVESYFDEQILTSSTIRLQDVPVRRWYDSDNEIFYAYIIIPFSYVEDLRRNYLNNAESVYTFYSMVANELVEKSEIYSALLIYLEGLERLIDIRQNIESVGMQDQTTYDVTQLSVQYETLICDLFNKIEITSRTSETQVLDSKVSYPGFLEVEVVYKGNNTSILVTSQFPLEVVPVGKFEANISLTQKGDRYSLNLDEIVKAEEFNEIELLILPQDKIQIIKGVSSLSTCKEHLKKTESVRIKGRKNTRIIIYIEQIENGLQKGKSTVIDGMRSELADEGFIIETSNEYHCAEHRESFDGYLVCGEVLIEDRSNPRPNFYFATAIGNIKIIDARKNIVLKIVQSEEIREGGNGYQQARGNSISVLSQKFIGETSEFFRDRFNNVSH